MKTIIFLGPSLSVSEAMSVYPNADYRPPAGCGDVLRAVCEQPDRIVLIDGYFHYQPAVWHKELLYAMEQGIIVYGASSMGALRAAELDQFGMLGVGYVYQNFRDQHLTDDDEVAVLHRDARADFEPLSDAMVSIRSTLDIAAAENVISYGFRNQARDALKQIFYPNRNLRQWLREEVSLEAMQLLDWIYAGNYIDRKKEDAILCLNHLTLPPEETPKRIACEKTMVFRALQNQVACGKYEAIPNEEKLLNFCRAAVDKAGLKSATELSSSEKNKIVRILSCLFERPFFQTEDGVFCVQVIADLVKALETKNIIIMPDKGRVLLAQFGIELPDELFRLATSVIFVVETLLDRSKINLFF